MRHLLLYVPLGLVKAWADFKFYPSPSGFPETGPLTRGNRVCEALIPDGGDHSEAQCGNELTGGRCVYKKRNSFKNFVSPVCCSEPAVPTIAHFFEAARQELRGIVEIEPLLVEQDEPCEFLIARILNANNVLAYMGAVGVPDGRCDVATLYYLFVEGVAQRGFQLMAEILSEIPLKRRIEVDLDEFTKRRVVAAADKLPDRSVDGECVVFEKPSDDAMHVRLIGIVGGMGVARLVRCVTPAVKNINPDANYELMKALQAVPLSSGLPMGWVSAYERSWSAYMVHVASLLRTRPPSCIATHKHSPSAVNLKVSDF